MATVKKIENIPTGPNGRPRFPVIVEECGELWINEHIIKIFV